MISIGWSSNLVSKNVKIKERSHHIRVDTIVGSTKVYPSTPIAIHCESIK